MLSFDTGGTTGKGCVVRDHVPLKPYEFEVARVHEFKRGSGRDRRMESRSTGSGTGWQRGLPVADGVPRRKPAVGSTGRLFSRERRLRRLRDLRPLRLAPGATLEGPALIEEAESTCVLAPGDLARVDAHLNLVVDIGGSRS